MANSLLPPASTKLERSLEATLGRFDPTLTLRDLWNPDTCPEAVLPYLAWAQSVDEWDKDWTVTQKRQVIKAARGIHRQKGTLAAVRRALASVGHGDAAIISRADLIVCDGSTVCDGTRSCGGRWATRRVILKAPATVPEAYQIKRLIEAVGRNCVHLLSIEFAAVAYRCDGTIICDGTYTCGAVDTTLN